MKRNTIFFIINIMLLTGLLSAQEMTVKIGECIWYTEQNSFEEIVAKAKKAQKPILAVFASNWCNVCQKVKQNILASKEFKEVEKDVVLFFIEETRKEGKEYIKKYKVKGLPTFTMFSPDGVELETSYPGKTTAEFVHWVQRVKGEQQYRERLRKNPADWEALFEVTRWQKGGKVTSWRFESKIELLRKALHASGSAAGNTSQRQKVYERLADYLYMTMVATRGQDERGEYARTHRAEFDAVMKKYYPDNFRYDLKWRDTAAMWSRWLLASGDSKGAVKIYEESDLAGSRTIDFNQHAEFLDAAIGAYLATGKEDEAEALFQRASSAFERALKANTVRFPPNQYMEILTTMILHYAKKGDDAGKSKYTKKLKSLLTISRANMDPRMLSLLFMNFAKVTERLAGQELEKEVKLLEPELKAMLQSFHDEKRKEHTILWMAEKYGLWVNDAIKILENQVKKSGGKTNTYQVMTKATLLNRLGQKETALQLLLKRYETLKTIEDVKKDAMAKALNNLAWTAYKIDMVKPVFLEIAKKSLELERKYYNLDTLAVVLYKLGHIEEAIKYEKEALSMTKKPNERRELMERLERWEKKKNKD